MIGLLSGKIKSKETESLIIDVGGVGYQVFTPPFVWQKCKVGQEKSLFVHTHVREDDISLFGFATMPEKKMFVDLISVSGIGPKLALSILSHSRGTARIIEAIQKADVEFFKAIKGVGKKSAQRLIVDLKPKVGDLEDLDFETEEDQDLVEALEGLGFSKKEIKKSAKGVKKDLPLEEKIRLALKTGETNQ